MKAIQKLPVLAILSAILFSLQLSAQETNPQQEAATANNFITSVIVKGNNSLYERIVHSTSTGKNKQSVQLKWQSTRISGISHYMIERSFDGNDFFDAGIIMTEEAKATSLFQYYFTDKIAAQTTGRVFYRIKQVQTNGDFEYIQVDASTDKHRKSYNDLIAFNNKH